MAGRALSDSKLLQIINNLDEIDSGDEENPYSDLEDNREDATYLPYNSSSCSEEELEVVPVESPQVSIETSNNPKIIQSTTVDNRHSDNCSVPVISSQHVAKDSTIWTVMDCKKVRVGRRGIQNIVKEIPGPTAYAKRAVSEESVLSAWYLFIDHAMLRHIQKCTQIEARRLTRNKDWSITLDELDAFISLLYARGAYSATNLDLDLMWSVTWGPPIFSKTMCRNRFREIMRFLRFDERISRSERLKSDKFALISSTWNKFIENCIYYYKPGPYLTVDEQLFPSKARCRFTQYMANKPDKFGIKFWMLADCKSKYICNAFPYLGRDEQRPSNESVSESVVLKLAKPFLKNGRNITTDNFFTSVSLANKLKQQQTSLVGTMNKNRRELPPYAKESKAKLYDSVFMKTSSGISLTIYQGKKKKSVAILSNLHTDITIADGQKKLPETVQFYNETKFGVDIVDQMARKYTTRAGSRRWPMHVFYNILDLAGINAWIIYKECTGSNISRHTFLLKLGEELSVKYMNNHQKRSENLTSTNVSSINASNKRRQCQLLISCKRNKTSDSCSSCKKAVCGKCVSVVTKTILCANCN